MNVKISDFEPFIAVATFRSFRLAAEAAGVTSSAMSHSIRQLEERLKIRLFNRTTRSVSLTDAGHKLFESLHPLFDHAMDAIEAINDYRDTPIGTLRSGPKIKESAMSIITATDSGAKILLHMFS